MPGRVRLPRLSVNSQRGLPVVPRISVHHKLTKRMNEYKRLVGMALMH